jgi:hypothetical protein
VSWVTGPTTIAERKFNVTVGTYVILLVNGRPRETVYTTGRNGGIVNLFGDRRVPQLGVLQTLVFDSAVDVPRLNCARVRLADGATISVAADVEVKPAWEAKNSLLLEWVNRYGANPARIEQNAKAALDGDFATAVAASFSRLSHAQVHAAADKRTLLRVTGRPTGLLAIDRILNVTCTEDPQVALAHQVRHEARTVAPAQAEADRVGLELGHQLDALRAVYGNRIAAIHADGELGLARARAQNEVIINRAVAALYGLSPAEVAFPQVYADRQRILAQTVQSVLTENADMLPLLAELDRSSTAGFLREMFSATASPAPASPGPAAQMAITRRSGPQSSRPQWGSVPGVADRLAAVGITAPVVGSAVHEGPQGPQRIALVASGPDQVIGGIGMPGNTNAVVVRERDTVLETVNRVLTAAAQWCEYTLGYVPANDPRGEGRLLIDIDQAVPKSGSAHQDAALAVAAWVAALNTLTAAVTPQVSITVLGQR